MWRWRPNIFCLQNSQIIVAAFERYNVEKDLAEHIKKEFDKRHGPMWHCIVGRNFGTFTLSNLGMLGVDRFDAILPPGTGAIMAVGASEPTIVATKDGHIGMKNQMQVNVTADHRVIYCADLASFLQTLSKIIEYPKDLTF